MKNCVVVGVICMMLAMPVFADFVDGFEGATLDPFWTDIYTAGGSITFPSTANVHSGLQSVQLNSFYMGVNKNIQLTHNFDTPVYGTFSIWFYDTGADVSSSNYANFYLIPEVLVGWGAGIYTQDYDSGPQSGGNYYLNYNSIAPLISDIDRTQAWHLFEISALPESLTLSIDQQTAYTGIGVGRIDSVNFSMYGPYWRPAWTTYWDDFTFIEVVPEPATLSFLALGAFLAGRKRRT